MPRVIRDRVAERQRLCEHCFALVGYVPKGVKRRAVTDYQGSFDRWSYSIECPSCKERMKVNPNKDPLVPLEGI